jgi:hypothetical protein
LWVLAALSSLLVLPVPISLLIFLRDFSCCRFFFEIFLQHVRILRRILILFPVFLVFGVSALICYSVFSPGVAGSDFVADLFFVIFLLLIFLRDFSAARSDFAAHSYFVSGLSCFWVLAVHVVFGHRSNFSRSCLSLVGFARCTQLAQPQHLPQREIVLSCSHEFLQVL